MSVKVNPFIFDIINSVHVSTVLELLPVADSKTFTASSSGKNAGTLEQEYSFKIPEGITMLKLDIIRGDSHKFDYWHIMNHFTDTNYILDDGTKSFSDLHQTKYVQVKPKKRYDIYMYLEVYPTSNGIDTRSLTFNLSYSPEINLATPDIIDK